ncbi:MAG: Fur family transcriptional regulator [bacterium]|nr:Fur family transcriptional regulator [bacterium]
MSSVYGDRLRQCGLKATPARLAVLAFMAKQKKPLTVERIITHLEIDQATLYRNLRAMSEKGLMRRIELQQGHAHYEIIHEDSDHHHLVCTSCGRIEDFDGCSAQGMLESILARSKYFTTIVQHSFELFGACRACETKKSRVS